MKQILLYWQCNLISYWRSFLKRRKPSSSGSKQNIEKGKKMPTGHFLCRKLCPILLYQCVCSARLFWPGGTTVYTNHSIFKNPSIYNILRWVAWTMGQTNRRPSVWCSKYYLFYTFNRLRPLKTLYFYFCNFIKKIRNKLKGFLQRILKEIMKKNNTWNIRHLVDDSFVPSSKGPSVLYCKLTDF